MTLTFRNHNPSIALAHGVIQGITFAVIFPVGGALYYLYKGRSPRFARNLHAFVQCLGLLLAVAGTALGVTMVKSIVSMFSQISMAALTLRPQSKVPLGHGIIGLVVTSVLLIQPLLYGIHRYRNYNYTDKTYGLIHRLVGQIFIVLGTVNVALGLHYANAVALFYTLAVLIGLSFSFWIAVRVLI